MGLIKCLIGEEPSIFEKLAFNIKHNRDVGAYGEYLTQYLFNSVRFKGYYKTLQNIYIPYKVPADCRNSLLLHRYRKCRRNPQSAPGCRCMVLLRSQWDPLWSGPY